MSEKANQLTLPVNAIFMIYDYNISSDEKLLHF